MRYVLFVSSLAAALCCAQTPIQAVSPDGRLKIDVMTIADHQPSPTGALSYSVSFEGKPVVEASPIRLDLEGFQPLGPAMRIVGSAPETADETYHLIAGKTSTVRDHYNGVTVDLEETTGPRRKLRIEARAFDDAVAFRYIVPEQSAMRDFRLKEEHTEFRMSKDAISYALELPNFRTMYESEFLKLPISAFSNSGGVASTRLIGLPLLMDLPGVAWVALTEADMRGNAAMYLVNPERGHTLESKISPSLDDPDVAISGSLPHQSPWRVFLISEAPARLVESTAILNLNPPCAIQDTSWIHPGKSAWDWWSGSLNADGKHAFTTDNMKYYVDFAAKSGLEYMLVDAGWSARNDIRKMNGTVDIPELVRYATTKHVKVWIWCHWTGVDAYMNEAFPMFEKWGVAGVKIDFMSRDDQWMIQFYYRVAENAARHHLMVDFHGATKPTGMERTWPNILGYEGVLGMEQSKWSTRDNPDNHVTLPFTRMLVGPMDYTPGGFDNVTQEEFVGRNQKPMVMGTRAHQLAMYAIYESPFQMVSDYPHAYQDQPAFGFIKATPPTWDETRGLNGEPGEYVTVARRRGREWFLGSMTNWTPRQLDIPLSFLGPGEYTAKIYADESDSDKYPKDVSIREQKVDRNTHLKAALAPGGGLAVEFVPLEKGTK